MTWEGTFMLELIGERLKREREEKNLTINDICHGTKISRKYIEGLENNDFDSLPGSVYIKGFTKLYADALNLDQNDVVDHLQRSMISEKEIPLELLMPKQRLVFSKMFFIPIGLIFSIILVTLYGKIIY